jgi:hypothetical protein
MAKSVKNELIRLHGIGAILAVRLADAGIDTFAKVAAAGEEGLIKIKGMNPRAVPSILAQAGEIISAAERDHERFLQEIRERTEAVSGRIVALAADVRERFSGDMAGRDARKIEKEIFRIIGSLEILAAKSWKKGKRAAKCLSRTEELLSACTGSGLEDIRKNLKKMRISLKRLGI